MHLYSNYCQGAQTALAETKIHSNRTEVAFVYYTVKNDSLKLQKEIIGACFIRKHNFSHSISIIHV